MVHVNHDACALASETKRGQASCRARATVGDSSPGRQAMRPARWSCAMKGVVVVTRLRGRVGRRPQKGPTSHHEHREVKRRPEPGVDPSGSRYAISAPAPRPPCSWLAAAGPSQASVRAAPRASEQERRRAPYAHAMSVGVRKGRVGGRLLLLALVALATLLALGYVTVAHRVTGPALGYSLRRATNDGYSEPCRRSGPDWYCPNGAPEGIAYRLTVHGHCWRGRSVDRSADRAPFPHDPKGCVGLADHIRFQDRH